MKKNKFYILCFLLFLSYLDTYSQEKKCTNNENIECFKNMRDSIEKYFYFLMKPSIILSQNEKKEAIYPIIFVVTNIDNELRVFQGYDLKSNILRYTIYSAIKLGVNSCENCLKKAIVRNFSFLLCFNIKNKNYDPFNNLKLNTLDIFYGSQLMDVNTILSSINSNIENFRDIQTMQRYPFTILKPLTFNF